MRAWTLIELFRLTRADLFGLYREIVNALAAMPDSDPERAITPGDDGKKSSLSSKIALDEAIEVVRQAAPHD